MSQGEDTVECSTVVHLSQKYAYFWGFIDYRDISYVIISWKSMCHIFLLAVTVRELNSVTFSGINILKRCTVGKWLMEYFTTVFIWCVILLGRQVPGTKSHPHSLPALICCHGKEFIAASLQVCLCNSEASIIWLTAVVKCLVYFKSRRRVLEALKLQVHARHCFCLFKSALKCHIAL